MGWEGPKWGREGLFPAKKNLADILDGTDFDFENLYFLDFFGSQISGLGPAWAHPLGPSLGPPTWAPRAGGGGRGGKVSKTPWVLKPIILLERGCIFTAS